LNLAAAPQHDPFATSLTGRRLGRYEVLARLASGGMAGVYVARAIGVAGFERLVAIKVLHPHLAHEEEFISMFLDEARLAARIRHPNVVPTTDISDTQDAGFYLVMDYIEGDHLGAMLQAAYKAGERLTIPVSLRIVMDALSGLGAAHALTDESGRRINLVHRDISPHNIMVGTDGIARLTDFGVAKAEVRLSTTREGQFKGKLAYMSPEHASSGDTDQRSDLFSMGIILWECLTGRRLFRAENHAATLNLICLEPIPSPSSVDPSLAPFDAILAKALDRDPAQRFQTAEDFADAVEHHAQGAGGLGTARTVAKMVRSYASEKLAKDRELIQSSIASLSLASAEPEFPTRPGRAADPETIGIEDLEEVLEPGGVAAAQPPQSMGMAEVPQPSRGPWIALAIAALAVAGVALAYLFVGRNDGGVTSSTISDAPDAPPSTVAAAAPEVTPEKAPEPAPAPELNPASAATDTAAVEEPLEAPDTHEDEAAPDPEPQQRRRSRPTPVEPTAAAPAAPRQEAPTRPAPEPVRESPVREAPAKKPPPADDDLFLNPYRR